MSLLSLTKQQKQRLSTQLDTDLVKLEAELAIAVSQLETLHAQMKISTEQLNDIRAMMAENKDKIRDTSVVQKEIDKLMPYIEKAKETMRAMGPEQLNEIATYKNPPERIKMVLEAICLILVGKKLKWDLIKRELTDDFVNRVLKIDWSEIKPSVYRQLKNDYFSNPEWDVAKIYRASQAIGPLAEWMIGCDEIIEIQKKEDPNKGELKVLYDERSKLEEEEKKHLQILEESNEEEQAILSTIEGINKRKTILTCNKEEVDEKLREEGPSELIETGVQTTTDNVYIEGLVERHGTALNNCEALENDILKLHEDYGLKIQELEAKYAAQLECQEKQLAKTEEQLELKNEHIKEQDLKFQVLEDEKEELRNQLSTQQTKFDSELNALEVRQSQTINQKDSIIEGLSGDIEARDLKIQELEEKLKKALDDNEVMKNASTGDQNENMIYIKELEERIAVLTQRNEELDQQYKTDIAEKDKSIQELEAHIRDISSELDQFKQANKADGETRDDPMTELEEKIKALNIEKENLYKELEETKKSKEDSVQDVNVQLETALERYKELQNTHDEEIKGKIAVIEELQQKLDQLTIKKDDLSPMGVIGTGAYISQDNDDTSKADLLERKNTELISRIEELQANNATKIEEVNLQWQLKYDEKVNEYEALVAELRSQVGDLKAEVEANTEKFKSESELFNIEINELQKKHESVIASYESNIKRRVEEAEELKEEIRQLKLEKNDMLDKREAEKGDYEIALNDLKTEMNSVQLEIKQKDEKLAEMESEMKDLEQDNQIVRKNYELLKSSDSHELKELKEQYEDIMKTHNEYLNWSEEQLRDKTALIAELEARIKALQNEHEEKLNEIALENGKSGNQNEQQEEQIKLKTAYIIELEKRIQEQSDESKSLINNLKEQLHMKELELQEMEKKLDDLVKERNLIVIDNNKRLDRDNAYINELEQQLAEMSMHVDKEYEDTAIQTSIRNMGVPKAMVSTTLQTDLSTLRDYQLEKGQKDKDAISYRLYENTPAGQEDNKSTQCDYKLQYDVKVQTDKYLPGMEAEPPKSDNPQNGLSENKISFDNNIFAKKSLNVLSSQPHKEMQHEKDKNKPENPEVDKAGGAVKNNKSFIFYNENKKKNEVKSSIRTEDRCRYLNSEIYYNGVKLSPQEYEKIISDGRYDSNVLYKEATNKPARNVNLRPSFNRVEGNRSRVVTKSADIVARPGKHAPVQVQKSNIELPYNTNNVSSIGSFNKLEGNSRFHVNATHNDAMGQSRYESTGGVYNSKHTNPNNSRAYLAYEPRNMTEARATPQPNDKYGNQYIVTNNTNANFQSNGHPPNFISPQDPRLKNLHFIRTENGKHVYRINESTHK